MSSPRLRVEPRALGDGDSPAAIADVVAEDAPDKRLGVGRLAPHRDRLHA